MFFAEKKPSGLELCSVPEGVMTTYERFDERWIFLNSIKIFSDRAATFFFPLPYILIITLIQRAIASRSLSAEITIVLEY